MLHFSRKDNLPHLLKNPDIITKNGDEIEDRAEGALGKRLEPVENPRSNSLMCSQGSQEITEIPQDY